MIFSDVIYIKISIFLTIFLIVVGLTDRYVNYYKPKMSGHSSFSMKSVVQRYRKHIEKNQDLGSSFTVYNGSTRILDLVGGYEDLEFEEVWNRNTISQLFSVSNVVGIVVVAHLFDRDLISYDDPISKYLPFCHESIYNITISDIFNQKGKMPFFTKPISITDYRDDADIVFQKLLSQISVLSDDQIFHKYTSGIIIDALVRRTDPSKRTLAQYFNEEIGHRYHIDLLIGLPRTQIYRAARIYNPTFRHFLYAFGYLDMRSMMDCVFGPSEIDSKIESTFLDIQGTKTKNPEVLEITLGSWNVFSNADSLGKLFSVLFFGSENSPPAFKETTIRRLSEIKTTYYDTVLKSYVSFTTGGLMSFSGPKNSILNGWRDSTGQFVWIDLERNLTVSYVTNHVRALSLNRDYIHYDLLAEIYNII